MNIRTMLLPLLLISNLAFSQAVQEQSAQDTLPAVPQKMASIEYEKVFQVDSATSKDQLFNAVKQALIRNTNYKHEKIDEDREAGSISTAINYSIFAKPGIVKLEWLCTSLLTVDVRDKKFRVRINSISHKTPVMGVDITATMDQVFQGEKNEFEKGKWKSTKSMIIPWDNKLKILIESFGLLISFEALDDF
jgi:hypothetical protein